MKILSNNLDLVCGGGKKINLIKIGVCGALALYNGNLGRSVAFTGVKVVSKIGSKASIDLDYVASEFCSVVGIEVIRHLA